MSDKTRLPAVLVPLSAWETFVSSVKADGLSVSDGLRQALQEYLEKRGVAANFEVGQWGGYRPPKEQDETE